MLVRVITVLKVADAYLPMGQVIGSLVRTSVVQEQFGIEHTMMGTYLLRSL